MAWMLPYWWPSSLCHVVPLRSLERISSDMELLVYLEFAEACGDGVGGLGAGRIRLHSLSLLAS